MNKQKITAFILALVVFFTAANSIYAISIFDTKNSLDVYKASEDDSDFALPFTRICENRIEIDKPISQIGLFATASSIEINKKLDGIQLFYSGDTIRINSDTEYSIIISNGNVIVNGIIEKSTFIFSNGSIILGENANIKGNLICYAPKLEINSQIDGNILGEVSTLSINNNVNGKIKMNVYDVNFSENVIVEKGIEINTTNKNLSIPESVGTSIIDVVGNDLNISLKENAYKVFIAVISNLIIYLFISIFVKKDKLRSAIKRINFQRNVIYYGVRTYLCLLALIALGIILLPIIAKLGISIIIFASAIMIIFTLLKNVIFAIFVSQIIEEKYKDAQYKVNSIIGAILTLLIIEILEMIPYIGQITKFIIFIITIGIILELIQKKSDNIKEEKIEPDTIVAK